MAEIELQELKIKLWDNVYGIGFINDIECYVSLKEIGRCIGLENEELKSFMKLARVSKKISHLIKKRKIYHRKILFEASTVLKNDIPYIYDVFLRRVIERKMRKNMQIESTTKLKMFHSDYIYFDVTRPLILIETLKKHFQIKDKYLNKDSDTNALNLIEFIMLSKKCNLDKQNSSIIHGIMMDFYNAISILEEMSESIVKKI